MLTAFLPPLFWGDFDPGCTSVHLNKSKLQACSSFPQPSKSSVSPTSQRSLYNNQFYSYSSLIFGFQRTLKITFCLILISTFESGFIGIYIGHVREILFSDRKLKKSMLKCAYLFAKRVLYVHQLLAANVSQRAVLLQEKTGRIYLFSNDTEFQQTSSFVLLHGIASDECCFGTGEGGGASFKIETELHNTSPLGQNMCSTTCMFHDVRHKTFWAAKHLNRCRFFFCWFFFCLCLRFQYLNSYAEDCDLACFGCTRTCLWSNRPLLEAVYLFNTIVVWTEGIINRLTKHTILLWGWENPV